MSEPEPAKTGIIVLGMHRSGTSLVAHLLGELGCSYGGELMPAKSDNPLGYWEHAEIVDLHDEFLSEMGRRWEDPRPWTEEDFRTPAAQKAAQRLQEVFARDFGGEALWVLKDPRICRLLPLWRAILEESGHEICFLHVLRDPYAVAKSLAARDALGLASSLLLWLRHLLESERFTRGQKRAWVEFEQLVRTPVQTLKIACARMGVAERLALAGVEEIATRVVSAAHVHHRGQEPTEETPDRVPWIDRAREALGRLLVAEGELAHSQLDRLAAEIDTAKRLFQDGTVAFLERRMEELAANYGEAVEHARELALHYDEAVEHARELALHYDEAVEYVRKLEKGIAEKQAELDKATIYARRLEKACNGMQADPQTEDQ